MNEQEAARIRRTALTLLVLDRSFKAHQRGRYTESRDLLQAASEEDPVLVSVVQGGVVIGKIPNPESDPAGWADYVQAAQDQANRLPGQYVSGPG